MRVFLYARVSTDAAKEWQDPNRQLVPMREYCQKKGWEVVAEFIDFLSGSDRHRPEFRQMLIRAKNGECDLIFVDELSRLSRFSATDALFLIKRLKDKYKVSIKSHSEQYIDTQEENPLGEVFLFFISWIAAQERKLIKARVKSGIANKRKCLKSPDGKHKVENAKCILCGAEGKAIWKGGRPKGCRDAQQRERRWKVKPAVDVEDLFKE